MVTDMVGRAFPGQMSSKYGDCSSWLSQEYAQGAQNPAELRAGRPSSEHHTSHCWHSLSYVPMRKPGGEPQKVLFEGHQRIPSPQKTSPQPWYLKFYHENSLFRVKFCSLSVIFVFIAIFPLDTKATKHDVNTLLTL